MDASSTLPAAGDDLLLRRFLAGEAGACRQIDRWTREILLYRRLNLAPEDVDDIVQEVVVQVWQAAARPGFHLRHGLRAFVRTVTLARAIDRVRRLRVRRADPVDETLPDTGPGPADAVEAEGERARLHRALDALDERCREVIRLHYFEGWPYARIAVREQRSEGTMRARMFECIRRLRERMRVERGADAR
ncbi:MAG: RNA polymerase sigma factor [Candidatus Eiseniibacteriota bacterium]